MKRSIKKMSLALIITLAMMLGTMLMIPGSSVLAVDGSPVSGDGIVPIEVGGNPACTTLGYGFGFKIEGQGGSAYTGTFPFDLSNGGVHTGGAPNDPSNSVTLTSDGFYFNWTATLGIDAVIVKGGSDANAYIYFPEDNGDTGLASPELDNGNLPAISHIEFCYDYELSASKTATAQFTRTYTWTIDKSVAPTSHSGYAGESFSSDYDVVLDQSTSDSDFAVAGTISVSNPTPFTVGFSVSDVVNGSPATVTCSDQELAPGESTTCSYSASLAGKVDGTNVATITSTNSYVGGASASAAYVFGAPTTIVGYPTVNVSDSVEGSLGSASGDTTFEYTNSFSCPTDATSYTNGVYTANVPNTATIVETGQLDDANVSLTCYAPVVTKTAAASYDETHSWSISKSVNPASQSGYPGETLAWNWTVIVSEVSSDSNFAVSGSISVFNPADEAMTVSVSDLLNDGTTATVNCGSGSNSLTVAAGATGTCTYSATPTGKTATLNTATATLNSAGFSGTAAVSFVKNVIGGTATVTDSQFGFNQSLTAGAGPWTFPFSGSHVCSTSGSAYGETGSYSGSASNVASVTASNGQSASASATTSYLCEAGFVDLLKLTNGSVNPDMNWHFRLYEGPDGFGTSFIGNSSTFGDADGVLTFGVPALSPAKTYTVCELGIPAGYSSQWQVNGVIVNPYNPDADSTPAEDVGNRCVDFGAGTTIPVSVGETIHFVVDNTAPGGDPRTPGYWKNWNACSTGGQEANAERNGGYANGFWLLDDVLDPAIGGGIVWDDILSDGLLVNITSCEQAVEILDQRVVTDNDQVGDGKKIASDAARTLAMHLLAAQLNFGAGACVTQEVLDAALAAETLLDSIDFDGTFSRAYLTSKSAGYADALELAGILDDYNNGMYCGSTNP